jgi:hypothetical protein
MLALRKVVDRDLFRGRTGLGQSTGAELVRRFIAEKWTK